MGGERSCYASAQISEETMPQSLAPVCRRAITRSAEGGTAVQDGDVGAAPPAAKCGSPIDGRRAPAIHRRQRRLEKPRECIRQRPAPRVKGSSRVNLARQRRIMPRRIDQRARLGFREHGQQCEMDPIEGGEPQIGNKDAGCELAQLLAGDSEIRLEYYSATGTLHNRPQHRQEESVDVDKERDHLLMERQFVAPYPYRQLAQRQRLCSDPKLTVRVRGWK